MTMIEAIDKFKLSTFQKGMEETFAQLSELPCDTAEQETWWADKLSVVQTALTEFEADRQELVRPLIDNKKKVDEYFKDACVPANMVKDLIKRKLADAAEKRLALVADTVRQAQEAAAAGDHNASAEALARLPDAVKNKGAVTTWVWEIETIDETQVPDAYWCIDTYAINRAADAFKASEAPPAIPGVKFKRTARVAARRK